MCERYGKLCICVEIGKLCTCVIWVKCVEDGNEGRYLYLPKIGSVRMCSYQ